MSTGVVDMDSVYTQHEKAQRASACFDLHRCTSSLSLLFKSHSAPMGH